MRDYAIFGLDVQGHVTSWNTGAEGLNGYRADEIIGKPWTVFFTPEDVASGKPQEELRREAEGRYEAETYRVRKHGSRYWADVYITAVHDDAGKLRGFSKVIRDVTARKKAEDNVSKLNRELKQRVDELAATHAGVSWRQSLEKDTTSEEPEAVTTALTRFLSAHSASGD